MSTDTRVWRIGTHYGIHIYAAEPGRNDVPIATAMTPEAAEQIVRDHNTPLQERSGL